MNAGKLDNLLATVDKRERQGQVNLADTRANVSKEALYGILHGTGGTIMESKALPSDSAVSSGNLSQAIKRVIQDHVRLDRQARVPLRQAALVELSCYFFDYLATSCELDPRVYSALEYLQLGVVNAWIQDTDLVFRHDYPARTFLEHILDVCKGYDEQSGRRGTELIEEVDIAVREAVDSKAVPEIAYRNAMRRVTRFLDRYNRKTQILEKRLIDKERGETQRRDAKSLIRREVLLAVSGKRLPRQFFQFLEEIWEKYLYITYLREGVDSRAWIEGVEVMQDLVWSLTNRNRESLFLAYGGRVSKTLSRVRAGAGSINHSVGLLTTFLETADAIHVRILEGEDPNIQNPVEVSLFESDHADSDDKCGDEGDPTPVETMRIGEWFREFHNGLWVRRKLVERNDRHRYLLFSNLSGIQSRRLDYEEVVTASEQGTLKRLDMDPVLDRALNSALQRLAKTVDGLQTRFDPTEEAKAETLDLQLEDISEMTQDGRASEVQGKQAVFDPTEEAKVEMLDLQLEDISDMTQDARASEAQGKQAQQVHEGTRAAAGLSPQTAPRRKISQSEIRRRALRQAVLEVQKMKPGGWVDLITDDNQRRACRLGLKSKRSGRMVFVDQVGRKLAEFNPAELAQRILEGNAAIIDFGLTLDHGDGSRYAIEDANGNQSQGGG